MRFGAWLLIFLRKEQYRMKLVLAEKPSVAMSLSKVIGANQRGDGYMEGNGYLASWCVGYLVELSQPEAYDEKYAKWRYDDLPILPEHWQYQVSAGTKKQFGRFSIKQMEKTRRKRRGSSRAFSRISGRWRHIRCRKKGSVAWK